MKRLLILSLTGLLVIAVVGIAGCLSAFESGYRSAEGAKVVAVTVTSEENRGLITWQGGHDIGKIVHWEATADGELVSERETSTPRAGQHDYTIAPITGKRLTIVATFADGTQQVIYDKQL